MPVAFPPKYILRLDDLPKIVEADGTVYPVFMTLRDAARLFSCLPVQIVRWSQDYGLPIFRAGAGRGRPYIEIAKFNDWILANSVPRKDWSRQPDTDEPGEGPADDEPAADEQDR